MWPQQRQHLAAIQPHPWLLVAFSSIWHGNMHVKSGYNHPMLALYVFAILLFKLLVSCDEAKTRLPSCRYPLDYNFVNMYSYERCGIQSCHCLGFVLYTWGSAVQTSWVGVPLTITPTHCSHLPFWRKAWVAIKHHHWTFCCVCVRLQEATDWRDWGSTVSWMREVKCEKIGATCILYNDCRVCRMTSRSLIMVSLIVSIIIYYFCLVIL